MPDFIFDLSTMPIKSISVTTKLSSRACKVLAIVFSDYDFEVYQGGNPDYRIVQVISPDSKDENTISKILKDSFKGGIVSTEY